MFTNIIPPSRTFSHSIKRIDFTLYALIMCYFKKVSTSAQSLAAVSFLICFIKSSMLSACTKVCSACSFFSVLLSSIRSRCCLLDFSNSAKNVVIPFSSTAIPILLTFILPVSPSAEVKPNSRLMRSDIRTAPAPYPYTLPHIFHLPPFFLFLPQKE